MDINMIAIQPHSNPANDCGDTSYLPLIYSVIKNSNMICNEMNTLKYAGFGHILMM